MEFSLQQIAMMLGGQVQGDATLKVNSLGRIQEARQGQIAFLANPKYEQFIYTTQATAVIVNKDFELKKPVESALIRVDNAYTSFTRLLEEYSKLMASAKTGVEEPSFMGEGSTAGKNLYRGAFSYIGNNVRIGENVKIHPQVFIGDNCVIGNNTIIHPGVKVYAGNQIGSDCEIHSGTVIGSDGFGFAPQSDGSYKAIPQLGNVIIEDRVTIGANNVIDCATMPGDHTVIRAGAKLDNLIQVAHNVQIGKNTVIAAQAGISGSTRIGDNCMIGGQAGIGGHLEVANRTSLGAQSGLSRSIKEEGTKLFGTTAIDFGEFFRSYALFRKLPEIYNRLRKLEE
jgi:UDP-3-O-[3-hydroxymyristoyl] glucosamine N-acyltransferase